MASHRKRLRLNWVDCIVFAALIAAIVSSLGSMVNSIATIFTLDLYRQFRPGTSENALVRIGRLAALCAMLLAVVTARPLLGQAEQAFQFIQEFTGFFTPGIVVLFLLGLFWRRTTAAGALAAALGSAVFSIVLKVCFPEIPFMNRVGYVFLMCTASAVAVSLIGDDRVQKNGVDIGQTDFSTSRFFNGASALVAAVLIGLYWYWW